MFLGIGILLAIIAVVLIGFGIMEQSLGSGIIGAIVLVLAVVSIVVHFNTAQGARTLKSWTSNTTGGLERTVDVYDQSGRLIKTYQGRLDVEANEYGNKVLFDLNGKRTVIYNATVIVQEK